MKIFAASDIHGEIEALESAISRCGFPTSPDDILVLCGDYLEHSWENDVCDFAEIMDLQCRYPDGQVVCLAGNYEADWLESCGTADYAKGIARWVSGLPLFYETKRQIFVHAGICEEAEDLWRTGTPPEYFTHMFPPQTGSWNDGSGNAKSKDIVAGHVSVMNRDYLGGNSWGPNVWWDGENHFYLDGTSESTHVVPVLEYDCDTGEYWGWDADGTRRFIARR